MGENFKGQLILLLVGSGLTTGVGTWLSSHFAGLQRSNEVRSEQANERAKAGGLIEKSVLSQTSLLIETLKEASKQARSVQTEAASAYFQKVYVPARLHWNYQIYATRNEVGRNFGNIAARMIYETDNKKFEIDRCSIFTLRTAPYYDKDCARRRKFEIAQLHLYQNGLNKGVDIRPTSSDVIIPADVTTNLRVATEVMRTLLDCKGKKLLATERERERCGDTDSISLILKLRVNLTGTAQERLADEFLSVWTDNPTS